MEFEAALLGLPAFALVCALLLYLKNRNKPSQGLDKGFLLAVLPVALFCFSVGLDGQSDPGPLGGLAIMAVALGAPFFLLFLMFWVPVRLLAAGAKKAGLSSK